MKIEQVSIKKAFDLSSTLWALAPSNQLAASSRQLMMTPHLRFACGTALIISR
jgi:hypothetical protein